MVKNQVPEPELSYLFFHLNLELPLYNLVLENMPVGMDMWMPLIQDNVFYTKRLTVFVLFHQLGVIYGLVDKDSLWLLSSSFYIHGRSNRLWHWYDIEL
jgi:hypothetical protein